MKQQPAVLELTRISKEFVGGESSVQAVSRVSLTVGRGELGLVVGPSGSGKSTLLLIAGGLETPSDGHVAILGKSLSNGTRRERATMRRAQIAYVFQEINLLSALTASENVSMALELNGWSRKAAKRESAASLGSVGLEDKLSRFPHELSGGERQRVAIARALVAKKPLLLADEPTGALDSQTGRDIVQLIRRFCDSGGSALMVTHDRTYQPFADFTTEMSDGSVANTAPSE